MDGARPRPRTAAATRAAATPFPAFADPHPYDFLLQLVLSVLLSGIIGMERELKGKPAGLRTNILIGLGATMFTRLSLHVGGGDPGRIAAQVLTGIGFIGAGTILHHKGSVSGLTSAATIWVVTAIGMAVGSAHYVEAVGSTAVAMVVLAGIEWAEAWVERRVKHRLFMVHTRPHANVAASVESVAATAGARIERRDAHQEGDDLVLELHLRGSARALEQFLSAMADHPDVMTVNTAATKTPR
jgi:putative Mg2+ transporter-C (MgtC) family protein